MDIDQYSPQNDANLSCLVRGTDLVILLFKRLAKRLEGTETIEDLAINHDLDSWLEDSLHDVETGAAIPLIQLYMDACLTPIELYIILILFTLKCEHGLPQQCAALQGKDLMTRPTREFLFDLLYPHSAQKFLFYQQFESAQIFHDPRFVEKSVSTYNTVEYALTPSLVYTILGHTPEARTLRSAFVETVTPSVTWTDFIFDAEKKSALHKLFKGYFHHKAEHPASALTLILTGKPGTGKRAFCEAISRRLGVPLYRVSTANILAARQISNILQEVFADPETQQGILCFPDVQDIPQEAECIQALLTGLKAYQGAVVFTSPTMQALPEGLRAWTDHIVEFDTPTRADRQALWKLNLGKISRNLYKSVSLDNLASNYILTGSQIAHAVSLARYLAQNDDAITDIHLDQACQLMMYQSFDGLTSLSHVEKSALSHLVLPQKQKEEFERILEAARNHEHVMVDWGFGTHLSTGKGLCVLFDGPPGTGKTFAAEVIASELHRPLQRVDMSNLVSKWVGETGNNLARLFATARAGRAILLLDEADALLSKRTATTSKSTDRYANMEINILLQEIERYNGITILTTNHEQSLDEALQRRIQFRISFQNPEKEERVLLWKKLISPKAEIEKNINFNALGEQFEISGGYIKNAILTAAFKASSENRAINENDLFEAAMDECAKMGKLVSRL